MRLQKYDSYKDSGVEWLGEIPSEWEVKKLKYISKLVGGFPFNGQKFNTDIGVNVVRIGDINKNIKLETCIKSNENNIHKHTKIVKNDTLIALSGATTGKSCYIQQELNNAYINQRIAKFNYINSFLYFCISNQKFKKDILLGADGSAQENISNTKIENMYIPFPLLTEQQKIALFLDTKTQQLDKAIKQKEQLIKLLKERKQIVINEAVTKGLDKTVTMKDSGVEWLGEIPKHWEVKKIKYLGKFINGYAFNSNEFVEEGIRVMKISNIQTMKTDWTDSSYISEKYYDKLKQFRVNENDLVFALTRPIISTGIKATIIKDTEKILLNQRNTMLKPNSIVYIKWLYFIILNNDFIQIFDNLIDKTGQQPNISTKDIENIEIPLPHKDEQKQIVEYIENQTSKIDNAIDLQQKQIDKLKEYKTSLIDSIVTGKVRVCDE